MWRIARRIARRMGLAWTVLLTLLWSHLGVDQVVRANPPNVLVVLADDMGFADAGCYGGDIQTPHLDGLAANGLRFTQFYNTARCWPTRGALLTGFYAQQIRRDRLPQGVGSGQGSRPAWAKLLPQLLRPLGYRSYHSGKWHVDGMPVAQGFDKSYRVDDQDRFFSPQKHWEDDQALPPVKLSAGYYATVAIADHAIRCLAEHAEKHADRPFFHYLAFTAPHFPLHALQSDIKKYQNQYLEGYEIARQHRYDRQQTWGLTTGPMAPRPPFVPAWSSLDATQRAAAATRLAIHAAMVDRVDQELGRVLAQLKKMGQLENTVVFFLSDNGASAEILVRGDGHDPTAAPGSAQTFLCLGPSGAYVANTPLRRSKIFVHEGGISTPLIIHWPQGIKARGELRRTPGHVIDLVPTILEISGGQWPKEWEGKAVPRAPGRSLVPAFAEDKRVARDYLWWLHEGHRALRVEDFKIVALANGPWELYDLGVDRGEANDLATKEPDRLQSMIQKWQHTTDSFHALATADLPAGKDVPRKKKAVPAKKKAATP